MGPWRSSGKKELEETLRPQLEAISLGVPLPDESPTLHPYLRLWTLCKRFSGGMDKAPILPGPGSLMEQDAELMLAFEVCEDIWVELEERNKAFKDAKKHNPGMMAQATLPDFIG